LVKSWYINKLSDW